jgi:hypothetical protein
MKREVTLGVHISLTNCDKHITDLTFGLTKDFIDYAIQFENDNILLMVV